MRAQSGTPHDLKERTLLLSATVLLCPCFPTSHHGCFERILVHRTLCNLALFSSAYWWTTLSHCMSGKRLNFSFSISTKSWRELGVLGSSCNLCWSTAHKQEKQKHWKEGLSFLCLSPVKIFCSLERLTLLSAKICTLEITPGIGVNYT